MTPPRALILTEATVQTGLGHLSRCQALLAAFRQAGVEARMWLDSDAAVQAQVSDPGVRHLDWKAQPDLLDQLAAYPIVVVDSYLASDELLRTIAQRVPVPAFLDDTIRMDYGRGVVINGAVGAEALPYPVNPEVRYLLGSEYTLFREDFSSSQAHPGGSDIRQVVLTFGGNDPRNLLPAMVQLLAEVGPSWRKVVVAGPGFGKQSAIQAVADQQTEILLGIDGQQMRRLMAESQLAISAAGQTLQELVRVGVPTIAVGIVDNQLHIANGLNDRGAICYGGWWQDPELLPKIKAAIHSLRSEQERTNLSIRAQSVYDGQGPKRVVMSLQELYAGIIS